jgi:hypothetical protein
MDKAHDVRSVSIKGSVMHLSVDGREYEVSIAEVSKRLAAATPGERARFEVSPTGYGIRWPDLDEDLSIDGLIGVKHVGSVAKTHV